MRSNPTQRPITLTIPPSHYLLFISHGAVMARESRAGDTTTPKYPTFVVCGFNCC
jgi:hypothetical protein